MPKGFLKQLLARGFVHKVLFGFGGSQMYKVRDSHHVLLRPVYLLLALLALLMGGILGSPLISHSAGPAQFAVGPDNNRELLLSVISSAKSDLIINIYDFSEKKIADALIARIRDRKQPVQVEILIDGQPVRGMSLEGKRVIARLARAMTASKDPRHRIHILASDPVAGIKRRFRFDHAKYVIADGKRVFATSENFTPTGHGAPGLVGNRGWDVALEDPDLVRELTAIFRSDINPDSNDIYTVKPGDPVPARWRAMGASRPPHPPKKRTLPPLPLGSGNVRKVELFTSPNALPGVLRVVQAARKRLDLEQMSFPSSWKEKGPKIYPNPWVVEVIKASQKRVETRVLLNDDRVFARPDDPVGKKFANHVTAQSLNEIALCHKLPLEARIVDIKAAEITYIHNKGTIVDESIAVVSSVNGTLNSIRNNREVALVLHSQAAARYFRKAFEVDWQASDSVKLESDGVDSYLWKQMGCNSRENSLLPYFLPLEPLVY